MRWDIIFNILGSVGGAGIIFWALSSWLGKVWANRILEGDRAKYDREIEKIKKDFNKELENYKSQLELAKAILSRYSETQFHLYNELWNFLCDLKFAGDKLWQELNIESLLAFSEQLRKTRQYIMKGSLLIEDDHFNQLMALLDKFGDYEFGKKKLIEIRRSNVSENVYTQAIAEYAVIEENKIAKQNYDKLVLSIKASFKKRLRGDFEKIEK